MAVTKAQKTVILDELGTILDASSNVTFVHFKGLTVEDTTTIRKQLRSNDVGYKVIKKTLLRHALERKKLEGVIPEMEGEVAIAYGADLVAPSGQIFSFMKGREGKLAIVGGVFDGVLKNQEEMNKIATIPGLQVLRGMFVNVINSPIQRFAIALGEIAKTK